MTTWHRLAEISHRPVHRKSKILTVADLLHGAEVKMPPRIGTFRQAAVVKENPNQPGLALGIE